MNMQSIPDFRNARIMDIATQGSTISGIAQQTGIPFPTVRRTVYAFENIGIIKFRRVGKKVLVSVTNRNHPIVSSMIESAKWINSIIWDPDTFVARMFEKHKINYAFVGTSKIKYTRNESRNMVQIAIPEKFYHKAMKIIGEGFRSIGIKITNDPRETIGSANSIIYVKCFSVDNVRYNEQIVQMINSDENITIKIADDDTEKKAMRKSSEQDRMFTPHNGIA